MLSAAIRLDTSCQCPSRSIPRSGEGPSCYEWVSRKIGSASVIVTEYGRPASVTTAGGVDASNQQITRESNELVPVASRNMILAVSRRVRSRRC